MQFFESSYNQQTNFPSLKSSAISIRIAPPPLKTLIKNRSEVKTTITAVINRRAILSLLYSLISHTARM